MSDKITTHSQVNQSRFSPETQDRSKLWMVGAVALPIIALAAGAASYAIVYYKWPQLTLALPSAVAAGSLISWVALLALIPSKRSSSTEQKQLSLQEPQNLSVTRGQSTQYENFTSHKYVASCKSFRYDPFYKMCLQTCTPQKQAVYTRGLFKEKPRERQEVSIPYYQATADQQTLERLRKAAYGNKAVICRGRKGFFTYDEAKIGVMNFANGHCLGGGAVRGCWAQEERLFMEFRNYYLLYYISYSAGAKESVLPQKKGEKIPQPVIVSDVRRYSTDNVPYGHHFTEVEKAKELTEVKEKDRHPVNLLAISAIPGGEVNQETLQYHFEAAYLAFAQQSELGKPIVHTGLWGCGAFHCEPQVMSMVQMLAARAAGVELIFFDINRFTTYTEEHITALSEKTNTFTTPEEGLEFILSQNNMHHTSKWPLDKK